MLHYIKELIGLSKWGIEWMTYMYMYVQGEKWDRKDGRMMKKKNMKLRMGHRQLYDNPILMAVIAH